MLIVIVIIGIFAAALIPRLQSIQGRARHSKHKADLLEIYNINEIYRTDNVYYPRAGACAYNTPGCHVYSYRYTGSVRNVQTSGYLPTQPLDPINTITYSYAYGNVFDNPSNVGVMSYEMSAMLENFSDPQRCQLRMYKNILNGNICTPAATGVFNLYELSPHNLQYMGN